MGHSRFYGALAVLLFAAACAWTGAALSRGLNSSRTVTARSACVQQGGELSGLILRREQALEAGLFTEITARDGERLAAGALWAESEEPLSESAVFFSGCDGLEYLSPADAQGLSPRLLDELLASVPERRGRAKLLYGFDVYYAAFYEGSEDIAPGACYLRFESIERIYPAELLSLSRDRDRCALFLRLTVTQGLEKLRFCSAELISSRQQGLQVPPDALRKDEQGNYFVHIRSENGTEPRSVELIYSDNERCLVVSADSARPLREGDLILVNVPEDRQKERK